MNNFAAIDIIFAVLILIFAIRCAVRGFVSEVMSMAAVVLGLLAALSFFSNGGEFIRNRFALETWFFPEIIAFAVIFLIVFAFIKILEALLQDIIEGIRLGGIDRFLGIFFGIAQGLVVVAIVLFILRIQPLFDHEPLLSGSFFAGKILPVILPLIPGIEGAVSV